MNELYTVRVNYLTVDKIKCINKSTAVVLMQQSAKQRVT